MVIWAGRARPRLAIGTLVIATALLALAAACQAAPPAPTASQDPPPGPDLVEPAVQTSTDGLLQTTLTAALGPVQVGGRQVTTTTYNSSFPGPTLRVRPGDELRVRLVNQLDGMTNLHTHGFHTSPLGFGDNVLHHLMPGQTWELEFGTLDDHPPGLYWYHPHAHGDSDEQVSGGMAGAIINQGAIDELPGIAGLTERLLLIQATQFAADGTAVPPLDQQPDAETRYINGQVNPTIRIRPGETQRWRIGNISSDDWVDLQLDGHQLHQIAADANPMDRVVAQDNVLLGPAERAEVLVQAGAAGSYELRTMPFQGEPEAVLATMVVEGEPMNPQPLPTTLLPFEDLSVLPIDRERQITFQILDGPEFVIDGQEFDPTRVDQLVQLGGTEEWTINNATSSWHPFHIHINDFQVVAINGQPYEARGHQDTVPIPPNGSVTMRTRFLDFPGAFVYHCHILGHEDAGMMGLIEVQE